MRAPFTLDRTPTQVPASSWVIPLPPCASCSGVKRDFIEHIGDDDGDSFCSGGSCPQRFLFVSEDRQQLLWWSQMTRRGDWKNFSREDDNDDGEDDCNGQEKTTNAERDEILFSSQPSSPSLNDTDIFTEEQKETLKPNENVDADANHQEEVVKEHSSCIPTHLLENEDLSPLSALGFDAMGKDSLVNSVVTEDEKNSRSGSNTFMNTEGLTTTITTAASAEGTERECFIQKIPANGGDIDDEGQKTHLNGTLHTTGTRWMKPQGEDGSERILEPHSLSLSSHDEVRVRLPSPSHLINRSSPVDQKGKMKAAILPLTIPLWTCDSLEKTVTERANDGGERTYDVSSLPLARDEALLEGDENGLERLPCDRIQNVLINPSLNTTELSRVEAYVQPTPSSLHATSLKGGSSLSPLLSCVPASLPSFQACQKGYAIEVVIVTEWGCVIRFFLNNIVCTCCLKEFTKGISDRQDAEMERDITDFPPNSNDPKVGVCFSADEVNMESTPKEKTERSIAFPSLVFAREPEYIFRMSLRISSVVTHSTILTTLSSSSPQRWRMSASETSVDGYSHGARQPTRQTAFRSLGHTNGKTDGSCNSEGRDTVGTAMLLLAFYLPVERLTEILKLEDPFRLVLLDFPIRDVEKRSEKPGMLADRVSNAAKDLGIHRTTVKEEKHFLSSSEQLSSCPPPCIPSSTTTTSTTTAAAAPPPLAARMPSTTKPSSFSPFFSALCSKRMERSSAANGMSTLSSSPQKSDVWPVPSSSSSSLRTPLSPSSPFGGYGSCRVLCRCAGRLSSFLWEPLQLHLILIYSTSIPFPHADSHRVPPSGYSAPSSVHLSSRQRSETSMDRAHSSPLTKNSVVVEIFSWYEERIIRSSFPSSPVFTSALCWSTLKHGRPSPNCALIAPGSAGDGERKSACSLWIGTDKGHVVVLPLSSFSSSSSDAAFASTSSSTVSTTSSAHHQGRRSMSPYRFPPSRSSASMSLRGDGRVLELPPCPVLPSPPCPRDSTPFVSLSFLPEDRTAKTVQVEGAMDGVTTRPLSSTSTRLFQETVAPSPLSPSATPARSASMAAMKALFLMVGGREVWGYREGEDYVLVWDARHGTPLRQLPLPAGWRGGGEVGEEDPSLSRKPRRCSPFPGGTDSRERRWGVASTLVTMEYVWFVGIPYPSPCSSVAFPSHAMEPPHRAHASNLHPEEGTPSVATPSPEEADGIPKNRKKDHVDAHPCLRPAEWRDSARLHAGLTTTRACLTTSLLWPQMRIHHWVPSSTQTPLWLEQRELRRYARESEAVQTTVSEILSFLYTPIFHGKVQKEIRPRKEEHHQKDLPLSSPREKESPFSSPFSPQDSEASGMAALGDLPPVFPPESTERADDALARHSPLFRAVATRYTSSAVERGERNGWRPPSVDHAFWGPPTTTTAAREAWPEWMHRSLPETGRKKGGAGDARDALRNPPLVEQLIAIQQRVEEYEWCKEILVSSVRSSFAGASCSLPSSPLDAFSILQLVEMLFERYTTADENARERKRDLVRTSCARKYSHAEPSFDGALMDGGAPCCAMAPDGFHLRTTDGLGVDEKRIEMVATADDSRSLHSFLNSVQSLWRCWASPPSSILQGTAGTDLTMGETLTHLARRPHCHEKNTHVCQDSDDSESSFFQGGGTAEDTQEEGRRTWHPESGPPSTPPQTVEDVWKWLHFLVTSAPRERLASRRTQRQAGEIATEEEEEGTTSSDRTECVAILSNPLRELSFSSSSASSSSSFVVHSTYASREERMKRKTKGQKNWKRPMDDTVDRGNRFRRRERGGGHRTTRMKEKSEKNETKRVFGTLSSLIHDKGSDHENTDEETYESAPLRYDREDTYHKGMEHENPYRSRSPNATACLEVLLEEAQQCRFAAEGELQSVSRQLSATKDVLAVHQEQVSLLKKSLAASQQAAEKSAMEASTRMALEGRLASLSTELLATKSSLLSSEEREEKQRIEIMQLREQVNSYQLMEQHYHEKEQLAMHAMEEFRSTENDIMAELEELLYTAKSIAATHEEKIRQTMDGMGNGTRKTNPSSHCRDYRHHRVSEDASDFIPIEENAENDPDTCIKNQNPNKGREGKKTPQEDEEECSYAGDGENKVVYRNRDYFFPLQEAVANCYLFVVNRLKSQKQYFRDVKSNLISVPV